MALVNCSECKKAISSEAESCPHCGKPRLKPALPPSPKLALPPSKESGLGTMIFAGFVGFVFLMVIINAISGSGGKSSGSCAALTPAESRARELSRDERQGMGRQDSSQKTFLFIVVVVPAGFTAKDLKALGEIYRQKCGSRWQVEVDVWDSEAAFKRYSKWQKDQTLYDENAVSEKQYIETPAHQRAKYRKNPKMDEHALTIYRKPKSTSDEPVAEVVRY